MDKQDYQQNVFLRCNAVQSRQLKKKEYKSLYRFVRTFLRDLEMTYTEPTERQDQIRDGK
jgi:hypothetical protein